MTLALITLLMVKHVIADYFMQFRWMTKHKSEYGHWKGMAHSEFHGLLTWVVLSPFVGWILALGLALLDTFVHYHVDYVKSNFWKSKNLGPTDKLYWATHGVDQLLHFLTYVAIVALCV